MSSSLSIAPPVLTAFGLPLVHEVLILLQLSNIILSSVLKAIEPVLLLISITLLRLFPELHMRQLIFQ